LDPFLKIGVTFATLQSSGTTPSSSGLMNIIATGLKITASTSLKNEEANPYPPAALLLFKPLI